MTPKLTRAEIERLSGDFDRGRDLGYSDQRSLLAHALAEAARLAAAEDRGIALAVQKFVAGGGPIVAAARAEGVREGIERCAVEARRYAEFYPPHSDGRNTFVMLAERFDEWHGALAPAPAEAPTTPTVEEDDGWIEWRGGECPLTAVDVKVGLRFRDGRAAETMLIRTYRWQHIGANDDIIAYRIVQPAEASAPAAPEEAHHGWFYLCPDTGFAWSEQHPVESGEAPDAGQVRAATATAAVEALTDAWRLAEQDKARITALEAENAKLREIVADVVKSVEGINLGHGEDDRLDWTVFLGIGTLRRARALLQGQEVIP